MDLPRNRVELNTNVHPSDLPKVHRKKIKKQCPVPLGINGHHLASRLFFGHIENILQVCGLSTKPRSIIDNLALNFILAKVNERHLIAFPLSMKIGDVPL
jgi:hypothetical protein